MGVKAFYNSLGPGRAGGDLSKGRIRYAFVPYGITVNPAYLLTNVEILSMNIVPKSLAIIGAGAVGVEFASIFARFGTKVTVLEMLPRLVPVEDEDVSKELLRCFKKAGIRCETGAKAENIRRTAAGVALSVTLANGQKEELETEKLKPEQEIFI